MIGINFAFRPSERGGGLKLYVDTEPRAVFGWLGMADRRRLKENPV